MGFSSLLEDEVVGPLNEVQRKYTGEILTSSDALLRLIDDLLVMSRMQAGKFAVEPLTVEFPALLRRSLEGLEVAAGKKSIHLLGDVVASPSLVKGDPLRLEQVLNNLIGNAVKFSPPGSTVTVRAHTLNDMLRCEVVDSGPGIAPADHPKLFQRFGQLDTSNTREHSGTGLGLSIVKAIVEAHGGHVGVDSVCGEGSAFWFEIPIAGCQRVA
jgi:signal transduction histidine kinase